MANELCPHCQLPRQGAHSCMDSMRAEIAQLRGNLSLAEEGLANYALEEKQLRADISQAYDLRDKAEGRYCTALGEIERLRKQIEILQHANRFLSEQIPSAHEPSEQRLRTPLGEPALTHVDGLPGTRESVVIEPQGNADESPALFPQQMEPDTSPLTHQEMFSAIHSLAADIVRLTAAVPAQCTQGASRDASSEFVCPNHGPVQQLTDSGDCPMCYQDRHAPRTGE